MTRQGGDGKEGTGMYRLNGTLQDLGIAPLNWGNRCNSELCENWPFVTLNQRAASQPFNFLIMDDYDRAWRRH